MDMNENTDGKLDNDMLYLEQLNTYCRNTENTPEYIRAMAMYTQALYVIEDRYSGIEHMVYRR